jgi:hypothetical protein
MAPAVKAEVAATVLSRDLSFKAETRPHSHRDTNGYGF